MIFLWIEGRSWATKQRIKSGNLLIKWVDLLLLQRQRVTVPITLVSLRIKQIRNKKNWPRIYILSHRLYYHATLLIGRTFVTSIIRILLSLTPSKKNLNVKSYHEIHFSSPPLLTPLKFDYNHESLKFVHPSSPTLFPSIVELHRETHTVLPPPVSTCYSVSKFIPYTPRELSNLINPTCNRFFVQYIPEGSIQPRWFLVHIELELTQSLKLNPNITCNYLVALLARHPCDNKKIDDDARWWPEWHEYTIGTDNIPDFGQRVLFHPLRKPPLDKYRLWTDTIPLSGPNCYLSSPFHFEARHDVLNPCNYIARDQWLLLHSICSVSSVVPPMLSPAATTNINPSTKTSAQPHSSLLPDKPHRKRKTTSTSSAPPLRRSSRHQL